MAAPGEQDKVSEHDEGHNANVLESREQPLWEAGAWPRRLAVLRERLATELRLAAEEHTALRRDALRRLLQREWAQQQRELRRLGWAFYVERL